MVIYKEGLLRTEASKEEKESFGKALAAFDFKKSVKETINELSGRMTKSTFYRSGICWILNST